MAKEIERKYLIKDLNALNLKDRQDFLSIKQCYLKDDKNFIVRLRLQDSINGHKAFITIKGKTKGISRLEYEYEIPYVDALEMIVDSDDVKIEIFEHCKSDGLIYMSRFSIT